MKKYLEIADSADYSQLIVEGEATLDQCYDGWEEIIKDSSHASGRPEYDSFLNNLKHYNKLLKDYNDVKASITILYFEIDLDCIALLKRKGYKIDISGNTEKYTVSLNKAMVNSDNLITKLAMRNNQIQKAMEGSKGSNQREGFEEVMARLIANLGIPIDDNVTLARYNEYNKIIKEKFKASQKKK